MCHAILYNTTIMNKSPLDSTAVFIFFCHFLVPSGREGLDLCELENDPEMQIVPRLLSSRIVV